MTDMHAPAGGQLAALLKSLLALERAAASELAMVEEKLPELRRQARAKPKRRGGKGSPDAEKYKLGSILALCGFSGADDLVLLGFFACGDRALQWLAEARLKHGPTTFAEAVKAALADPVRADWCRQWGEYRRKIHKKAAYDASVTEFIESGKAGPREKWRRDQITPDQFDLIEDICEASRLPLPELANRGEAFEWIYACGGNPAYWQAPEEPEEWKE
jgi:hypothetical protein